MKPLTLFILKADSGVFLNSSEISFGDIIEKTIILDNRNLAEASLNCKTDWFGYIFSDEYLEDELKNNLPLYLHQNEFNTIVFIIRKSMLNGKVKFYQSPRLFKRDLRLKGMLPILEKTSSVRALDGFLEHKENGFK